MGLERSDGLVDQGWNHAPEGLGQRGLAHRLHIGRAERPRGLDLTSVDALEAAAHNLGDVGLAVQGQRDGGRSDRAEFETGQNGQAAVAPHELEQRGRIPERLDIRDGGEVQPLPA